jgi:hypothetical protein
MRRKGNRQEPEKMTGKSQNAAVAGVTRRMRRSSNGPNDPSIHPLIYRAAELYWRATQVARKVDWIIVLWILMTLGVVAYALVTLLGTSHATHLSHGDGSKGITTGLVLAVFGLESWENHSIFHN